MKIVFQKCSEKELLVLSNISRETFIDAFAEANDPADFRNYIDIAFSQDTIKKELENVDSHFFFCCLNEKIVGYFKLNYNDAQSELKEKEGVELQRIYIEKEYQGHNLGSETLAKVLDMVKQLDKQYIWLGVWEHNLRAIQFYENHGFSKFGTHPYYIGTDKQIDWLMRKEL